MDIQYIDYNLMINVIVITNFCCCTDDDTKHHAAMVSSTMVFLRSLDPFFYMYFILLSY